MLSDVVNMLHQAWKDIKKQTIVNRFRKAGFVQCQRQDDSDSDSDATDTYNLAEFDDLLPTPPASRTDEEFDQLNEMDATTQCQWVPTADEICLSVQLASGSKLRTWQ